MITGKSVVGCLVVLALIGNLRAGEKPKIDRATAERTALALVPSGQVKEAELEREHGLLVWSFDISKSNSRDIVEVLVDATTGKVVSQTVESAADERKETAGEQKKK